jgi:hypothetical protein
LNNGTRLLVVSDNDLTKAAGELHRLPGSAGGQFPGRAAAFRVSRGSDDLVKKLFRPILAKLTSSIPIFKEQAYKKQHRDIVRRRYLGFIRVLS